MASDFKGLTVVSFESRRAKEIEKLIKYHGGVPLVAPSMREVPLSEATEAIGFAERLIKGGVDIVLLLTGVGTRALVKAASTRFERDAFLEALGGTTIVARGPKPVAALKELSLKPDLVVPEPNTWRDLLEALDVGAELSGATVTVQEYGVSNPELIKGLRGRGAEVIPVPVYKWALPEDLNPLRKAIAAISSGNADIVLFTSAQQVRNVFEVALDDGTADAVRSGFTRTVIGSIGPTTTEAIAALQIRADYEPDSPKMGNLVREMARTGGELLRKKRVAAGEGVDTNRWRRTDMVWPEKGESRREYTLRHSRFLKACRREPTDYTPIWIMRQAGRFLREYRELRKRVPFVEMCKTPELAADVTLMAVERLGVDAAIIFSDILLILESMGVGLEYTKGDGPHLAVPLASEGDVNALREFDPSSLSFVFEGLSISRRALDPGVALLGFAGAPFTVASYAIEGGGSGNYIKTKRLMYFDPEAWHLLMAKLSDATAAYLNAQIEAGADALQVFDSWVGTLSPADYDQYVKPHMKGLFDKLTPSVPVIHFGTGTASLLTRMREAGGDVIGLDWRVNLDEAWESLGHDVAVQGNLDPVALFAPQPVMKEHAKRVLDGASGRPGHIFNLGHGVLPRTPVDNVLALVDFVHEYSLEGAKGKA